MRKQRAFLVAGFVLLLLGMGAWGCNQPPDTPTPCPTCTPCPPTSTSCETQLEACKAARIKAAEEGRATIGALETALATCQATSTDTVTPTRCVEKPLCHPDAISAEQAKAYVGEMKIVQGKVVDAKYAPGSSGQPTFLNLCYPYQDERRFTALIWGEDRQKFIDCLGGAPETVLLNREICVAGLIELYEEIPEIVLRGCDQLGIPQ